MTTLKSLPIAIFLALSTFGCDQAMDLDELEAIEAELGADEVSAMLEEADEDFDEDDYDDLDLDLTAEPETMPDPHGDSRYDVTDVDRAPVPDPAPETEPCQAPDHTLPAHPINDVKADYDGPGPDPAPGNEIDDLTLPEQGGCKPDPYTPFEKEDQVPLPPANEINDLTMGDDEQDDEEIDDFTATPHPGWDPDTWIPLQKEDQRPIPPGKAINDVTYGEDEEEPDVWPIDDLTAGEGN